MKLERLESLKRYLFGQVVAQASGTMERANYATQCRCGSGKRISISTMAMAMVHGLPCQVPSLQGYQGHAIVTCLTLR